MELREFNACILAYNKQQLRINYERTVNAWQTANLFNAAMCGKLKPLSNYVKVPDSGSTENKKAISKEEFEEKLKRAKRKGAR